MAIFNLRGILAAALGTLILMWPASVVHSQSLGKYDGSVGSFTNDALGDGHDRWLTGSYQRSFIFDRHEAGLMRQIELRPRAMIVSPWTTAVQGANDRPYSSILALGAFARGNIGRTETHLGGELILQGDQTGLPSFQAGVHDLLGLDQSYNPRNENDIHVGDRLTGRFEFGLARSLRPSESVMVRPYALLIGGSDQSVTAGADLVWGSLSRAESWSRDAATGQILNHEAKHREGFNLVAGLDVSRRYTSMHIPDGSNVLLTKTQTRARIGAQVRLGLFDVFFGQAWMSEGFVGQADTQRLGVLSISRNF